MIQPNPSLGPFYTYAGSGVLPCVCFHLPTVQKTAALVHHEQAHSTLDAKKWLHRLPPDAQQGRSSQAPGIAGMWSVNDFPYYARVVPDSDMGSLLSSFGVVFNFCR